MVHLEIGAVVLEQRLEWLNRVVYSAVLICAPEYWEWNYRIYESSKLDELNLHIRGIVKLPGKFSVVADADFLNRGRAIS